MRVLVLGGDGYLGWPTALHLADLVHDLAIGDNFVRRQYDHEMGVESLVPIETLRTRVQTWAEYSGRELGVYVIDLQRAEEVYAAISDFQPDTIRH